MGIRGKARMSACSRERRACCVGYILHCTPFGCLTQHVGTNACVHAVLAGSMAISVVDLSQVWERKHVLASELGQLNASAFRVPYGEDGEVCASLSSEQAVCSALWRSLVCQTLSLDGALSFAP